MKKKNITLICALAMAMTLTACGQSSTTSTNKAESTTVAEASTTETTADNETADTENDSESSKAEAQTDNSDINSDDKKAEAPDGQTPPDKPDGAGGENGQGTPPDKPDGDGQGGPGGGSFGGSGTTVNISDSTITTTADNSGGIQTTGGGTTNASNLTVTTSGNSSAAIRSDRGGGTVNVDGGTYTSNGYNSPAVYSTADITVKNAELTANNSEALVIEGENSITLEDCTVYGNMSDTNGTSSDENVHNVMIYQSMSGDAEVGTSSFSMTGGSLTSNNGDMFYITNTNCTLSLTGVKLTNKDSDGYLLNVTGNSASHGWGSAGSNGAQVTFTADNQTLKGNIRVDSISTLDMTLSGNSTFTGTVNVIDNEDGGTAVSDNAVITIENGSTWNLTGNCMISNLTNNGTINFNGYTITLADGTVLSE